MTQESPETPGTVPVAALNELVDEWQEFAEPPGWDGYSNGVRDATESCADELETLIEEHRP